VAKNNGNDLPLRQFSDSAVKFKIYKSLILMKKNIKNQVKQLLASHLHHQESETLLCQ
jgi:hypothetical protein